MLIIFDTAAIGMHMEKMVLWTRNIVSTTIVNTVSAIDTENEVIIRGRPDFFAKAVSAMSANHIELTTCKKKYKFNKLEFEIILRRE